jgi:hypothetical protein
MYLTYLTGTKLVRAGAQLGASWSHSEAFAFLALHQCFVCTDSRSMALERMYVLYSMYMYRYSTVLYVSHPA